LKQIGCQDIATFGKRLKNVKLRSASSGKQPELCRRAGRLGRGLIEHSTNQECNHHAIVAVALEFWGLPDSLSKMPW
jgi:hypothetical protein